MTQNKGFVRKHVFIDRHLQGRYMLTFLIPMVIMLAFWLGTLYFASQSIIDSTLTIVVKDVENKIAVRLQDQPNPTVDLYAPLVDDITNYLRKFSGDKKSRNEVLSSLLWIFGIGIFLVIIQVVLLTIFFSHRLAGPIYRFEKVCHSLIEGDYCVEIRLRKGDEMQNLGVLMLDAIRATRERLVALRDCPDDAKRREMTSSLKL